MKLLTFILVLLYIDSIDWANILFRIHVKFDEKHYLKIYLINLQYGEEALLLRLLTYIYI